MSDLARKLRAEGVPSSWDMRVEAADKIESLTRQLEAAEAAIETARKILGSTQSDCLQVVIRANMILEDFQQPLESSDEG